MSLGGPRSGDAWRAGNTWRLVARWTVLDVRRSRALWLAAILVAAVGVAGVVIPATIVADSLSSRDALVFLVAPLKVAVSLIALLAGYGVIAGPRTGGQLTLVLSLPVDRTSLVVGAFVGRAAVTLSSVAVGVAAVAVTVPAVYGGLPLRTLAVFAGLLALLALAVTAVAVGLSASASTRGRAAVAAVGAFVLFEFFWGLVPAGAHYLVEGSLPGAMVPGWVILVERLQPLSAFEATAGHVLPAVRDTVQLSADGASANAGGGPRRLADRLDGAAPTYLGPLAGVATLLGWTVWPLVVGWYRFRGADL